jgi:arabinofuranosyltransferase
MSPLSQPPVVMTGNVAGFDRSWRIVIAIGIAALLISLIRTGWLCDDAYITFRTADNIIHGFGPVWNADERVQAYTHPLWLAVCTVAFALTRDVFYTAIALGIVLTLGAAVVVAMRLASTPWSLVVCLVAMMSSKAFIDFSTSGLENPLTHLLLLVFVWRWWEEPEGPRRLLRMTTLAALCLLNRMDLVFLLAPALAFEAWKLGWVPSVRPLLTGFLPFILWSVFAIFYYGSPVPNTAYAKLNTTLAVDVRVQRGVDYFYRTLTSDPVTVPVMILSAFAIPAFRWRRDWPLPAGIALSGLYVLWVGGDFMMGRFFTAPFVIGVALLGRARWAHSRRGALASAAILALLGLLAPWEPALFSGYGYAYANNLLHGRRSRAPLDDTKYMFVRRIADERRVFSELASLLKVLQRPGSLVPEHEWSLDGFRLRAQGRQVVVRHFIGLTGYFAGPGVHIIDAQALSDPLLARIPAGSSASVMGHFVRQIPDGYVESIATGTNRLTDSSLAAYYEPLHVIVAGPLWNRARLITLARFMGGQYDHYLEDYLRRRTLRSAARPIANSPAIHTR